MLKLWHFAAPGIVCVMLGTGCTSQPPAVTNPPLAIHGPTKPPQPISDPVESADALLSEHGFAWGKPQQILRTVSNWYRVEYARDQFGNERVVLVNPENGRAEFPLPR